MIFLSHNHRDKPVVEQVAIRLRDIFGQDAVFYDSWSIQPGDGIVDKMNQGLGDCRLFLLFVSKNSLRSKMVDLEWQNALMKAVRGDLKIVPVKMDDCMMPPILLQSLYIDVYGQGLEVAVRQIVDVAQGRNTYGPGPQQFSNLRASLRQNGDTITVEIQAAHYMEPISHFLFLIDNAENEVSASLKSGGLVRHRFTPCIKLSNGEVCNAWFLGVDQALVPGFPLVATLKGKPGAAVRLKAVMHEKRRGEWQAIPL